MGTYSYGEHMELFGGPPEPGESYADLEQVDLARKAAKEDPDGLVRLPSPVEQYMRDTGCTEDEAVRALEDTLALMDEKAEPEPRCVVCDRETHTHEQLQACRSMLKRTDTAEIEEWRG